MATLLFASYNVTVNRSPESRREKCRKSVIISALFSHRITPQGVYTFAPSVANAEKCMVISMAKSPQILRKGTVIKMDIKRKLIFCGGDRRLLDCAALFAEHGWDCRIWRGAPGDCGGAVRVGELREGAEGAGAMILPIPAFTSSGKLSCAVDDRGGIASEYIFAAAPSDCLIFGGKISDITRRIANEYNHSIIDYGECEEFSLLNAALTAEAAIFTAMAHLRTSVWNGDFTVIGYGRIGRALALRLRALGAHVSVAARSAPARAAAESDGMNTVRLSEMLASPTPFCACFNTVPSRIVDDECAAMTNGIFIDLASAPGGFTDEARALLGERLITALSLPGKYCPRSAGEVIYKTVSGILSLGGGFIR